MDKIRMTHDLDDVVAIFSDAGHTWAIAGGWAIDLHLGNVGRRPHADVDVVCLRHEADRVRRHLARWDLHRVVEGDFEAWDGPLEPATQVWVRPSSGDDWAFEVLFEAVVDGYWRFRRNPRVELSLEKLIVERNGVPVLDLRITLLYKAKRDDDVDLDDLLACLHLLDDEDRGWLAEAVGSTHGEQHRWVALLRE